MINQLQKLASKPSDKKIRITRIVFALLITTIIVLGINATDVSFSIFDKELYDLPDYLVYILFIFPLVGLVRGIIDPGLFRKAIWKKVIIWLGSTMIIFSVFFLREKEIINTTTDQKIDVSETTNTEEKFNFDYTITDNLLAFFGFITLFVGFFLNNKNLTTKNEKFGEKIHKIRV